MIFGSKMTGRIGSFTKSVASSVFKKPAAPAAATAAAPASAPVASAMATTAVAEEAQVDWTEFIDALAEHGGLSMVQAKASRANGKFRAAGRLWCAERTGYYNNKLLLRAQLDVDLVPLPATHLIGLLNAAAVAARLFGCAMWLDDADQTLQVSWHVGDITRLSADEVTAAFDEAKEVVGVIENALTSGLAAGQATAPAGFAA
jgi:hypothetical protein